MFISQKLAGSIHVYPTNKGNQSTLKNPAVTSYKGTKRQSLTSDVNLYLPKLYREHFRTSSCTNNKRTIRHVNYNDIIIGACQTCLRQCCITIPESNFTLAYGLRSDFVVYEFFGKNRGILRVIFNAFYDLVTNTSSLKSYSRKCTYLLFRAIFNSSIQKSY